MDERYYWLGFSLISGIGIKRIEKLYAYFGALSVAWRADAHHLKQSEIGDDAVRKIVQHRPKLDLQAEYDKLQKWHITLITLEDDTYPQNLRNIADPPPVLYVRGTLLPEDNQALAMVGTRKCTKGGRDISFDFANQLAKHSVTIVSGLAHGIDAAAHQGALHAGGRTIAILGCGADSVYPLDHFQLAEAITHNGALISEFPIGTKPLGVNFPRRNRIISGLSLGVLVVEAPMNSGALITATVAAEQGRDVFAIPSSIYNKQATGANQLLQEGAQLVTNVKDILDSLNIKPKAIQKPSKSVLPDVSDEEHLILAYLSDVPIHVDEIIHQCGLSAAQVMSIMTILELKGLAQSAGYMQYSLV